MGRCGQSFVGAGLGAFGEGHGGSLRMEYLIQVLSDVSRVGALHHWRHWNDGWTYMSESVRRDGTSTVEEDKVVKFQFERVVKVVSMGR
jgi:hypothetical protein